MSIIAENNGTAFVLMPAGNHLARCYAMVHIGTIKEETGIYAGKEANKVRISWETPHECHDFGKGLEPFVIHKEFTLSMNEKATLRKMLEAWRGQPFTEDQAKAFDITKLLGVPCMLNVIHKKSSKGNDYADIASIAGIPKGTQAPAQVNATRELSYDKWNQPLFESLPDFVKNKIKASKEYQAMVSPASEAPPAASEVPGDDLPF